MAVPGWQCSPQYKAGSHYRLIFILAGSKKKVTQPEIKIKLTTLGSHFNQVKIKKRQSRRQSYSLQINIPARELTMRPNRTLRIAIIVLLFSAIQQQQNQLLAFVLLMERWINSCNKLLAASLRARNRRLRSVPTPFSIILAL